jgi:hypothetical protein
MDGPVRKAINTFRSRYPRPASSPSTQHADHSPSLSPGFRDRQFYRLHAPDLGAAVKLMRGRHIKVVMAIFKSTRDSQEGQAVRAELGRIGIRVRVKAYGNAFQAAGQSGAKIDILDAGAEIEYPDSAGFLANMLSANSMPSEWLSPSVTRVVANLSRLSGSRRQAAAAALADRLAVRDVPVIAYGNRVQGEFFSPRLGCRIFPSMGFGVDLAALCLR